MQIFSKKDHIPEFQISPIMESFLFGLTEEDQIAFVQLQRLLDIDSQGVITYFKPGTYIIGTLQSTKTVWVWTSENISLIDIWDIQQKLKGLYETRNVCSIFCKPEITGMLSLPEFHIVQKGGTLGGTSAYLCTELNKPRVDLLPSHGRLTTAKAIWIPQLINWYNEALVWQGYPIKNFESVRMIIQQLIVETNDSTGLYMYVVGDTPVGFGIIGMSLPLHRSIQMAWINTEYLNYGYQERLVYYLTSNIIKNGFKASISINKMDLMWNEVVRVLGYKAMTSLDCLHPARNTKS